MAGLPQPGHSFGRYRIVRLIGRGGMGAVYEATDPMLSRSVAIKIVLPSLTDDGDFRRRFEREAAVLARIRSRHIVGVHEYGEHDGNLYLVTEYFPDGDLHSWLRTHGPLRPDQALLVAGQLAEALADAEAAGVMHRDVKPSNVLLWARDDGRLIPYLCDFGIATDGDGSLTQTGAIIGSPAYMAPERHLGRPATPQGDVYALGCVLWAALTGAAPYSGTDYQLVNAHLHEPVRQLQTSDDVGRRLNGALAQMMAKEPGQRSRSTRELADHLRALADAAAASPGQLEDRTQLAHRPEPTPLPPPTQTSSPVRVGEWTRSTPSVSANGRDRRTVLVLATALTVLVLVAGAAAAGVYLAGRSSGPAPQATQPESSSPASAGTTSAASTAPLRGDQASAAAAGEMSYQRCPVGASPDEGRLVVAGLLPLTGANSGFAAPMRAGIGLAVSDIAAAQHSDAPLPCYEVLDTGDKFDLSVAAAAGQQAVSQRPSVVVGPGFSDVTASLTSTLDAAQVTTIAPSATLFALAGLSPWIFRTISSGYVEGDVLAQLIARDGRTSVAYLSPDDSLSPYGPKMRAVVQQHLNADGIRCVYGCQDGGDDFAPSTTDFTSQMAALSASGADAVVVPALTNFQYVMGALAESGFDMTHVYAADVSTADYSTLLPAGEMAGAQGAIAGAQPSGEFTSRLTQWFRGETSQTLTTFQYAAEAYDATMLAALAAEKGGNDDTATVQANLAAVSGATGGQECTTYADCSSLLQQGGEIHYTGQSGIGPLDSRNEPSSGRIGVYRYGADNLPALVDTLTGEE